MCLQHWSWGQLLKGKILILTEGWSHDRQGREKVGGQESLVPPETSSPHGAKPSPCTGCQESLASATQPGGSRGARWAWKPACCEGSKMKVTPQKDWPGSSNHALTGCVRSVPGGGASFGPGTRSSPGAQRLAKQPLSPSLCMRAHVCVRWDCAPVEMASPALQCCWEGTSEQQSLVSQVPEILPERKRPRTWVRTERPGK